MQAKLNRPTDRSVLSLSAILVIGLGMSLTWTPSAQATGAVSARVAGGTLIIRGDGADNNITIIGGTVTGRANTAISTAGRRFNTFPFGGVRDIDISMRGGHDFVRVESGPDDLTIDTGPGNDTIELFAVRVADDTQIDTQQGHDVVLIDGAADSEAMNIVFFRPEFTGRLRLTTDDGHDFVEFNTAIFRDRVVVRLGDGNDGACSGNGTEFGGQTIFNGDGGDNDQISSDSTPPNINFEFLPDNCAFIGGRVD